MRKGDAAEFTVGVRDIIRRGQAMVTDAVRERTPGAIGTRTKAAKVNLGVQLGTVECVGDKMGEFDLGVRG